MQIINTEVDDGSVLVSFVQCLKRLLCYRAKYGNLAMIMGAMMSMWEKRNVDK